MLPASGAGFPEAPASRSGQDRCGGPVKEKIKLTEGLQAIVTDPEFARQYVF
ncbi:hypothetical protein SPTER_12550 [Sporomusa termitida]|uniref:Uncharacterized protein n=2 Tax=Sporomusa termitida TaxID=2377 RepID=A0A517DRG7_9FIRM|nr:hypothetical protein SPTER_12550 [Sporomusa termitida]